MTFAVTIDRMAGAAFTRVTGDEDNGTPDPGPEVVRILREIADRIEARGIDAHIPVMDHNGATVGTVTYEEDA